MRYFVNIEPCGYYPNHTLQKNNNGRAPPEFENQVQYRETEQSQQRYCRRVHRQALRQPPLHQQQYAALHTTAGALHVQQCLRRTLQHVVFEEIDQAHGCICLQFT